MRTSLKCLSEFESRPWYEVAFPKPPVYGMGYFAAERKTKHGPHFGRVIWKKSFRFRTVAGNQLLNWPRYHFLKDELDMTKNEEKLNLKMEDIRWNDNRGMWFNCADCKENYHVSWAARIKYHWAGCPRCEKYKQYPSAVKAMTFFYNPKEELGGGGKSQPSEKKKNNMSLGVQFPDLVKQLAELNPKFVASLDVRSQFQAKWKCAKCEDVYVCSIRHRTGATVEGGVPLDASWVEFCPSCRWKEKFYKIGEEVLQKYQKVSSSSKEQLTGYGGGFSGFELMSPDLYPTGRKASTKS